jgi:2'-5' RNA ligase
LDDRSFAFFDDLRRRHFPPGRNHVPAHLTLFQQLPGGRGREIKALLASLAARRKPLSASVREVKAIGKGVAYFFDAPALMALRDGLADEWEPWLTDQDRAPYWPHVTVQNKVAPKVANTLARDLAGNFQPFQVTGTGLVLWRYLGGPWQLERDFRFAV